MPDTTPQIFVSYSHKDEKWLKRIQVHLKPLVKRGEFTLWSDEVIVPGEDWRQKIGDALTSAGAAILLVTADFLGSSFITENELPPLLQKAQGQGVKILWVAVSPCMYNLEQFSKYQALNEPQRPLGSMRRPKQEEELKRIATKIGEVLRESSGVQETIRRTYNREAALKQALQRVTQPPLIHGSKYTRNDIVTTHGDIRILESWHDVVSISHEELRVLPVGFHSVAGKQAYWKCESKTDGQSVEWRWERADGEALQGSFVFDPPVTADRPASFSTERYVFNGVAFTQSERLEDTAGKETREELRVSFRHIWDQLFFQVKFPEHRFPKQFRLIALDQQRNELVDESEFARQHLNILFESQNLVLALPQPLPGIRYTISWELPESASSQLADTEQGFVDEVTRRLLGLRMGVTAPAALTNALVSCRKRILGLAGAPLEPLSLALYVYDRQKSGLVCVCTADASAVEQNWEKYFFKPGRGVVGTSFRRRSVEVSPPIGSDVERMELVGGKEPPKLVICVPLFYGDYAERALAVLSFESESPSSKLRKFASKGEVREELREQFANWYKDGLAPAIGVSSTRDFWQQRVASSN